MKNSFRTVLTIVLFITFEYIALSIYFNRDQNNYAKSINAIIYINELATNVTDYTKLNQQNRMLNETNANLHAELSKKQQEIDKYKEHIVALPDSTTNHVFSIGAKIINQTIIKKDNIIVVNKGSKDGVEKNMAIISNGAIYGQIIEVKENYSTARSILSEKIKTSGALKKSGAICSIWWEGVSPYELNFAEMSKYSNVAIGDTVITTSFSIIFPQNINIGVVSQIDTVQNLYYNGKIKLFNDYKKLDYISIISNPEVKVDTTLNDIQ